MDSSVIVRRYLPGDLGHRDAVAVFANPETATVSSTLAQIEVSGALVRAARHAGIDPAGLLARFDTDITAGDPMIVTVDHSRVDSAALGLVRTHGIRVLDAVHIAAARIVLHELAGTGDTTVFISRDTIQSADGNAERDDSMGSGSFAERDVSSEGLRRGGRGRPVSRRP